MVVSRRYLALCLLLTVGCSREVADDVFNDALKLNGRISAGESLHDFGDILADGQTLRHEFLLHNDSSTVFRIKDFVVASPCCSDMELERGALLPPGETLSIPVSLRIGKQSERKRVDFFVSTDEAGPPRKYALKFASHARWEVLVDAPASIPVGQTARLRCLVVSRRLKDDGAGPPTEITPRAPLVLAKLGEPDLEVTESGLEIFRQSVEVDLPPSDIGARRGIIDFVWGTSGERRERVLTWNVSPPLSSSPRVLAIDPRGPSPVQFSLIVRSEGRDFRVMDIEPDHLALRYKVSQTGNGVALVDVLVDARRAAAEDSPEIRIITDHPECPVLAAPVVNLEER